MTRPLPPAHLARRVGVVDQADPVASFDAMGANIRETVVQLMGGPDWFSEGRRVLDFGCGAGKLLRHFMAEAERCEFYGCDIDEPSIEWLREHYSPPLKVFLCEETPGLAMPGEHVDLALAMSVFTHLTSHWAGWLRELHRVLRPGGRLIATFLGQGMSRAIANEPWEPDRIGMNVLRPWQPWDDGGPSVQHSRWWLEAHWGRIFDFEVCQDGQEGAHGIVVLRRRERGASTAELEAPEADEPREIRALRHNIEQLSAETTALASDRNTFRDELEAVRADRDAVAAQLRAVLESRR